MASLVSAKVSSSAFSVAAFIVVTFFVREPRSETTFYDVNPSVVAADD